MLCIPQGTVFPIIDAGHRDFFVKSSFGLGLLQTYDASKRASLVDSVSVAFRSWFNGTHGNDNESIMQGSGCGNYLSKRGNFGSLSSQIARVFTATETDTTRARFVNRDDSTFSLTGDFVCEKCKANWVIAESIPCFFPCKVRLNREKRKRFLPSRIKLDPFHWQDRYARVISKTHVLFGLFMACLRDALFFLDVDDVASRREKMGTVWYGQSRCGTDSEVFFHQTKQMPSLDSTSA